MTHATSASFARLLIALAVAALPATTFAQSAGAQAELMFRNAKRLLAQGKTAEACAAFDASQKLEPTVSTLLNQANCREKNGQFATAWGLFLDAERDTRSSSDDAGKQLHQVAAEHAAKLEAKLSTLTITVPADRRVTGLEIRRGAEAIEPVMWNQPLPIDGGTYKLVARAPGAPEWSATVVIANANDAKTIEVPRLRGDAKPVAAATKPVANATKPVATATKPSPKPAAAKPTAPAAPPTAAPAISSPAAPSAPEAALVLPGDGKSPWFCTESHRVSIGTCRPDRARCEEFRSSMAAKIHDLSACEAAVMVSCFAVGGTPYCAPTTEVCETLREQVQARATACQRRRVAPEPPPPPPVPVKPRGPVWWCTDSPSSSDVGMCKPARGDCETLRASLLERRRDLSACHEVDTAQCFEINGKAYCGPTGDTCEALRAASKATAACHATAPPKHGPR